MGELNRVHIVGLVLREQLGVNQISERLEMSQYNVSKHLRILKEAGLLEMEKEGQQRLYAVLMVPAALIAEALARNASPALSARATPRPCRTVPGRSG